MKTYVIDDLVYDDNGVCYRHGVRFNNRIMLAIDSRPSSLILREFDDVIGEDVFSHRRGNVGISAFTALLKLDGHCAPPPFKRYTIDGYSSKLSASTEMRISDFDRVYPIRIDMNSGIGVDLESGFEYALPDYANLKYIGVTRAMQRYGYIPIYAPPYLIDLYHVQHDHTSKFTVNSSDANGNYKFKARSARMTLRPELYTTSMLSKKAHIFDPFYNNSGEFDLSEFITEYLYNDCVGADEHDIIDLAIDECGQFRIAIHLIHDVDYVVSRYAILRDSPVDAIIFTTHERLVEIELAYLKDHLRFVQMHPDAWKNRDIWIGG